VRLRLPEEIGDLPTELTAVLEDCLRRACVAGARTGYPLTDVEIAILAAPFEAGVTTPIGVRAAAQRGLIEAVTAASPVLLEPVMALELAVPSDCAGKVIGSLQQKRGRVDGLESRGEVEILQARVPLSEMFDYMGELRSATKGRGTFSMEFSHYDQAPEEVLRRFGLA